MVLAAKLFCMLVSPGKPCTNIATAVGKNGKPLKNSGKENGQKLFKGRLSAGPHDQERVIGATASLNWRSQPTRAAPCRKSCFQSSRMKSGAKEQKKMCMDGCLKCRVVMFVAQS